MDKRTFLRTSSAILGGTLLTRLTACMPGKDYLTNWAGNHKFGTHRVHYPETVEDARNLIAGLSKVRILGSRHSFNAIADSKENLLSSRHFNNIISLDKDSQTVTVEAGIKYGELVQYLHVNGFALHNLASLPHISVAGSIATATHGSGLKNGNLASSVSKIEFVNAAGDIVTLSRTDGDVFNGAVVGLGAFGLVTKVTLDLQPSFSMKQVVYRNMPMDALRENFLAIMSSGYSVSLFTDWRNKNINQVWIKSKIPPQASTAEAPDFFGGTIAGRNLHPVENQSAESCTDQMGVPGAWFERLPHFKMGFTPSTGKELQSEYFVPVENGYDAIMAIEKLHDRITPHLFISEIRTIDADNLWMSPCYKKACVSLHTTWKPDWNTVRTLLPLMEEQLAPFQPRPHWGKLFTIKPAVLQQRIEKLGQFRELVKQYDPAGKFQNEFLRKNVFDGLAGM